MLYSPRYATISSEHFFKRNKHARPLISCPNFWTTWSFSPGVAACVRVLHLKLVTHRAKKRASFFSSREPGWNVSRVGKTLKGVFLSLVRSVDTAVERFPERKFYSKSMNIQSPCICHGIYAGYPWRVQSPARGQGSSLLRVYFKQTTPVCPHFNSHLRLLSSSLCFSFTRET